MEFTYEVGGFEFYLVLPNRPVFLQAEHIIASAVLRSMEIVSKPKSPGLRQTEDTPLPISGATIRTMQRRLPGIFSCSCGEFYCAIRVGRAVGMMLLNPELALQLIVEPCGIGSTRTFIRRLNDYTGLSPSQLKASLLAGKKHGFGIGNLLASWEVPRVLDLTVGAAGIDWVRFRMKHCGCRARGRRIDA